jgi:hypothetical protein
LQQLTFDEEILLSTECRNGNRSDKKFYKFSDSAPLDRVIRFTRAQ